jgi:diguanylate cyclase (GGDEF)-like protein
MKEKFSILLVDDDPTVIRIFSRILSEFAPLRFSTSGRTALKLARESVPDLVLLDVEMPDITGFEICRAFKNDPLLAAVPIIFITSHESAQLEAAGLQIGAADFIGKPPHAPLVLARVRTYQQLKQLSDTVRSAVTMDFLTGTFTRRQIEKTLAQELLRAQRSTGSLAMLIADIDDFAHFNARQGEEAGDACLHAVADALRSVARRPADVLGRHAGGQFALLLPDTTAQGALAIASRALEAVERLPELGITLTVGVGYHDRDAGPGAGHAIAALTPNQLIAAAEHALRSARMAGGHRVCAQDAAADLADLAESADSAGEAIAQRA